MKTENLPLNVRLLAVLVVCAACLSAGVFFLHRHQMRRHAAFFLEQAQTAKAAIALLEEPKDKLEQYRKASGGYAKFVRLQTDDQAMSEVLAEDGLLAAEMGAVAFKAGLIHDARSLYGRGLNRFEEALLRTPGRDDLRRKLVDILFELKRYREALKHLRYLCQTPGNRDELRKLIDRYSLEQRLAATEDVSSGDDAIGRILDFGTDVVNHERLFKFLGDDFWMLLEDAELLSIFGRCQASLNKRDVAVKALEKSILLAPATLETYRHLADALRAIDKPDVADYWMTDMVDSNRDSFRAYWMRGAYRMSLIGEANEAEGGRVAEEALADATRSLRKVIDQIQESADGTASSAPTTKELRQAFDAMRKVAPPSGQEITVEYGASLIEASRRATPAAKTLEKAEERIDGIRDAMLLSAECLLAWPDGDPEGAKTRLTLARDYAAAAVDLFPAHAPAYLTLADIEQRSDRKERAIECLQKGCEATGNNQVMLWRLAGLLIESNHIKEARKVVTQLAETGAPEFFLLHLRAHIDYAEGNWLAASQAFDKVRPDLTPWPREARKVDYLLAECYGKLGRVKDQRDAYLRCAASDRTWIPALVGLADTKFKAGQLDEAIEDYRFIVKLPDAAPAARIELARLLYLKNLRLPPSERNWKEVEQAVDEAQRAVPEAIGPTLLRAEILVAKNANDEATRLLAQTGDQLVAETKAVLAKRQSLLDEAAKLAGDEKKAKLAEAEKLLAAAQVKQASRPAVWQTMIGVALGQRDWEQTERLLAAAEKDLGDSLAIRVARARYLVERHGKAGAPAIRKLAENVGHFSPSDQVTLWKTLARLSLTAEDETQAQTLMQRVLRADPANADAQSLRFQIAARHKDVEAMEAILKEMRLVQATPGAFWHYGEAVRLVTLAEKGGSSEILERAKQSLAKAAELQPNWGQVKLLAGMISEREGDENAAIEAYLQAVDLGVRDPVAVHRVAQLLARKDRFREADRLFRLLGETQPVLSEEARREMRLVKARLGEFESAAALARKVAADSNQFEDHLWLGQLLGILGRQAKNQGEEKESEAMLREAEESLRKAVILKSNAPDAWVALIQFYGQNEQLAKAEQAIAQAKRQLSPAEAAIALSQCHEALGQTQRASEEYQRALEVAPRDATVARRAATFFLRNNEMAKGMAQLIRFLEGKLDATDAQKAWARRALASTLFAQGGEDNRKKAMEFIEQNLRANASSAPDQYVKAVMLAADMSGKRRREAIASLETFLQTQPSPEPEIQFTLAQLYLAENDQRKFRTLMRSLLKDAKSDRYLQTYAEALIDAREFEEARGVVEELAKVAPNTAVTLRVQARLAFEERQFETAIKLLKSWINGAAGGPDRRERLAVVAESLEQYARKLRDTDQNAMAERFSKEGEAVYQQLVDQQPGQELLMAAFLARQGRLNRALDLIEAKWESSNPDLVAMACFTALNGTAANQEQIRRVDKVLRSAIQKNEKSASLRVAVAVLRDLQGRSDEAEDIYRQILVEDPENATVLNNLAVLLALRQKNLDEASQLIDRAIAKVGASPGLLDSRAMVRIAQGKPRLALEDLQQALKTKPTAMLYFHQAQALQQNGQRTAAIEALKNATAMGLKEEQLQPAERAVYKKLTVTLD